MVRGSRLLPVIIYFAAIMMAVLGSGSRVHGLRYRVSGLEFGDDGFKPTLNPKP